VLSSLPPIVLVLRRKPSTAIRTTTARGGADRVERVGELRDGFLVAGGAVYVLGYLVWSVHAWQEGLGLLPALELQYLLAGSLLVLILLAALLTGMGSMRLMQATARRDESSRRPAMPLVSILLGAGVTIVVMSLLILADQEIVLAPLIGAFVVGGFAWVLLSWKELIPSRPEYWPLVYVTGQVAVAATVFYITIVYPNVLAGTRWCETPLLPCRSRPG